MITMKMGDDCSGKMVESEKKNMEGEYVYFHQIIVFYQSKCFSSSVKVILSQAMGQIIPTPFFFFFF